MVGRELSTHLPVRAESEIGRAEGDVWGGGLGGEVERKSGGSVGLVKGDHLAQLVYEKATPSVVSLGGEPHCVVGVEVPQQKVLRERAEGTEVRGVARGTG